MPAAGLRLFGAPVADIGEGPLQFRAERRFQLLAYLAIRKDWVARDELAHLFWPDQDNVSARRNLRWVLHSAKELRGLPDLEADRERVRFATITDVSAFDQAVAESRWTDATALYTGPLLDGLDADCSEPFQNWLRSARGRYADSFRAASLEVARQCAGVDDDRCLVLAERMLAEDPFDEQALRVLMRAFAATGRTHQLQRTYREFSERLLDELGLEPSAQTRALLRQLIETPTTSRADAEIIAPAPIVTSFIGRRDELQQIGALLDQEDCRLLTIIGPGGIGKSRLGAEVAAARRARGFVSLEALSLPSQIAPHVARRLGLSLRGDADPETLVANHLQSDPGLLVLDNFEHLIDGAALLVRWLSQCPRLQLLVTSRERLEVPSEWIFRLEGLSGAQGGQSAAGTESDAVRLFVERARPLNSDFSPEREEAGIHHIVRLVDGMPLAIELAAAWTRLLPCADIARDLEANLDLLASRARMHRTEHHSIRASFEYSWSLLVPRERDLLARLSVFRGGFTHEASRQVAEAALPALASLADKSLVRASPGARFSLHPLLRQFANEKLDERPESQAEVRARHAQYYCGMLARSADSGAVAQPDALAAIDADFENCAAAWQWALQQPRFDLVDSGTLPWVFFFERGGRMREGLELFSGAAGSPGYDSAPLRTRAHIEWGRAMLLMRAGSLPEAQERARDALRSYRGARDAPGILRCVNLLGMTHWQRGEFDHARTYFREGLKRSQAEGDARGEWKFAMNLALANQSAGDYAEARALHELAAANARKRADRSDLSLTLNNLGNLCIAQGDGANARTCLLESLTLAEETGNRLGTPFTLINLAILDIADRQYERARGFVERATALVEKGADRQVEPMCLYTLARIEAECGEFARARDCLGQAARIAVATQNSPNMVEVAIWAAHVDMAEHAPERAAEILCVVLAHPLAGTSDRKLAGDKFDEVKSGMPAAAIDHARRVAQGLTLEDVMARVIAAAPSIHAAAE